MSREELKACTYTNKSRPRSVRKMFLKIWHYSQENTCAGFSF